jgi:hypothetical protein
MFPMPTYTTRILVSLLAGASVVATAVTTRSQTVTAPPASCETTIEVAATPRL